MIEDVENLPPELQLVALGNLRREAIQVKSFPETHIDVVIAGHAEDVTFTGLARVRIPEVRECELRVASEQLGSAIHRPCWTGIEIGGANGVALDFPIGRPSRVVKHARRSVVEPDRQASIPTEDSAELPASDEAINHLSCVRQHGSSITERHLPYGVHVDLVADVEIGV